MNSIYLIGDIHTVNTFRICGIDGFTVNKESAADIIRRLLLNDDSLVILITREYAETLSGIINKVNLESPQRVVIEIPGIDDLPGFGRSLTSYITEALGVAL